MDLVTCDSQVSRTCLILSTNYRVKICLRSGCYKILELQCALKKSSMQSLKNESVRTL